MKWTCSHCGAINAQFAFKCHNCPNTSGDETLNKLQGKEALLNEFYIEGLEKSATEIENLKWKICTLFEAIKHGDEKHQAWLKEAIATHFETGSQPAKGKE